MAGERVQPSLADEAAGSSPGAGKRRKPRARPDQDGLGTELDRFVAEHPGGWNHDQWLGLLGTLRDRGFETSDQDAIGLALEERRRT